MLGRWNIRTVWEVENVPARHAAGLWDEENRYPGAYAAGLEMCRPAIQRDSGDGYFADLKRFYAALVLALTLSHAVTYALLRYKPRTHELLMWGVTCAVAGYQLLG